MDELLINLVFPTISSVVGGLVVYFAQSGIQLRKKSKKDTRLSKADEIEAWKSMDLGIRQGITNNYLFSILRYLFLGNLLWLLPEVLEKPIYFFNFIHEIYIGILVFAKIGALLSFLIGLGYILRYLKLRSFDVSFNDMWRDKKEKYTKKKII